MAMTTTVSLVGCSSSSGTNGGPNSDAAGSDSHADTTAPPSSGVDPSKSLPALDPADAATLCDWAAAQFGGYGVSRKQDCGGGNSVSLHPIPDRASCEAAISSSACTQTVGQYESCIDTLATEDLCTGPFVPPGCEGIVACYPPKTSDAGAGD
jgi:hypothetical protein